MGVIKSAMGDALLTSMWIFTMPFMRIFTLKISTFLGVQALPLAPLFITTLFVTFMVFIFSSIGSALGGASFNPTASLTFHAAGINKSSSLFFMAAVRFPAQAAAGVAGVWAILHFLPLECRENLKGPSLKVDVHTGAIAEGVLTFSLSLSLVLILSKGPRNPFLQLWLMAVSTVGLVSVGSKYTGPSMNPANAFGWAYFNNWHNSWELYYVYWFGPLVGATLAAWVFRFILSPSPSKEKKA